MMNGELPFRAEVISEDGKSSSIHVSNAKTIIDGVETILFDDEITLSTNSVDGDNTNEASASLSIPVNDKTKPEIKIKGNACVTNNKDAYAIGIKDDKKKLKIKSSNGLFAVIRIAKQRDADFHYFDVLFGSKGQAETIDQNGQKNRPHIAFYSTGNGKFIRLSSFDCELNSTLDYDKEMQSIYPSSIDIFSYGHSESIILDFKFDSNKEKVTLEDARFK